MTKQFLTITEAAAQLGVSAKTLRRWEANGKITPHRTIGNQRRYDLDKIKQLKGGDLKEVLFQKLPAAPVVPAPLPLQEKERFFDQVSVAVAQTKIQPQAKPKAIDVIEDQPPTASPTKLPGTAISHHLGKTHLKWGVTLFSLVGALLVVAGISSSLKNPQFFSWILYLNTSKSIKADSENQVLATDTQQHTFAFRSSVLAEFMETVNIKKLLTAAGGITTNNQNINAGTGTLTASNVIYSLTPGQNITITGDPQNPTISATSAGVLSLGSQTGDLQLLAGSGVTVNGLTISNSDPGSSQKIFANVKVGSDTLSADDNDDTIEFAAGTGITLTADTSNKKITIGSDGSTTGIIIVEEGDTPIVTAGNTIDFLGGDFDVGQSPVGEANVQLASILTSVTGVAGAFSVGTNLTLGGDTFSDLTGAGLTVSSNVLSLNLTASGTTGLTSSNSGLEVSGSGLTLLKGCSNGEILKWDNSGDLWQCASDSGGSTGIINVENNDIAVGASVDTLDFDSLFTLIAGPPNEANISITANAIGDTQLAFDTGQHLTTTSTPTFSTLALSSLIISGDTISDFAGTGLEVNSNILSTTLGTSVDLATEITGILPLANGGTGQNITNTNITDGQLLIGNNTSDGFSLAALTAGLGISIVNGSGSITIAQTGSGTSKWTQSDSLGILYPNISTLDLLVGGTTSSSAKFAVLNVNSGTPTASISAVGSTNLGLSLTADGTIQSLRNGTLTFGGNTTGNITVLENTLFQPAINNTNAFRIKEAGGGNLFVVDTASSRVGINMGGDVTPTLDGPGLEIKGSIRLSGATTGFDDEYTSPNGALTQATINLVNFDPGGGNQFIAMGLPVGSDPTARGITIFDARTVAHDPSLTVFSVNEANRFGLSYEGGSTTGYLKNTSGNIAIRNGTTDLAFFDGTNLRTGINTTTPFSALDVRGSSGTLSVATISGQTSFASLIVDNAGVGDLFTASKSGASKFTVTTSGALNITGGSAFTTTLTSLATQARSIALPDETGTICMSTGNCAGVGGTGNVIGPGSATDNAITRFDSTTGKLIQNSGVIIDDSNNISGVNSLTIAPTGNATGLTLTGTNVTSQKLAYLNANNTSGTIFDISYGASQTLTGALIGQTIDLNNAQLTATNQDVTGQRITLPTLTNTNAVGTHNLLGLQVNFGVGAGINQNGAGATIFSSLDVSLPALTQTSGTLTANGLAVTTPSSITTGGTANGVSISPTGIGAGSLNGINIATISAGAGSETALNVGDGWDAVLRVNGTPVINKNGVTLPVGGGTGLSSYTTGDILYASATNNLAALAGGAGNNGKVLTISSGLPVWGTISGSSCTDCVLNDPSSTATNTIAPTGQATTGLIVRQTSTASPTDDIFNITNSTGSTSYFRIDKDGNVLPSSTIGNTLTLTPATDTTALTLIGTNVPTASLQYINAKNQSGTIFNLNYGVAQTLSTSSLTTGIGVDLSTNVTATNANVTGESLTLPSTTNTHTTGTKNLKGVTVAAGGGINQNGAGGTTTYAAFDATIPPLTQTAGTLNAYGLNVNTPSSITTDGTANAVNVTGFGVGAGFLNGLNISAITGGTGTETAINIGAGWDAVLKVNGTTVIDGAGVVNVSNSSGVLPVVNGGSPFYEANGAILERLMTQDLLLGGNATVSAKFAVLNMNSGTPTASLAAGTTNNAAFLTGAGNLGTTNAQTLIVGGASTGNILIDSGTGNILLSDQTDIGSALTGLRITTGGNISDIDGNIALIDDTDITGSVTVSGRSTLGSATPGVAKLTVTGTETGKALTIFNETGDQNIMTASASGTTVLTLDRNGQLTLNRTTPNADKLTFVGNNTGAAQFTGTVTTADLTTNQTYTLPDSSGTICISGQACAATGILGFWQRNSGALAPTNITDDLLLGSTSTSAARFAFTNAVGPGTPTASISAVSNGTGLSLGGDGVIQSVRNNTLTLGGATTGNLLFSPLNGTGFSQFGGKVGINTANPLATLDVRSNSGTLASASISGRTSFAGLVVDNSGSGDLFTASSSGLNRFVIHQNGNVAIGTTDNTSTLLTVDGTIRTRQQGDTRYRGDFFVASNTLNINAFDDQNSVYIPGFFNSSTYQLNVGTAGNTLAMFVDSSGLTGFGNLVTPTNPLPPFAVLATLDVRARSDALATASISGRTAFAGLVVDNSQGDILTASSSGLTRFTVQQNGNVTVGSTPIPDIKFNVSSPVSGERIARFRDDGRTADATFLANASNAIMLRGGGGDSLSLAANDSATPHFTIATTGKIGIGTTSPLAALDIRANAGHQSTASVSGATSGAGLLVDNSGSGDLFTASSSGTSRFTINQNGNVGIGTHSPTTSLQIESNNFQALHLKRINNPTGGTAARFENGAGYLWDVGVASNTTNAFTIIDRTVSGGPTRLAIDVNGNVGINTPTNVPTNTLDVRGISGTTATASLSANTSFAGLLVDNRGVGDLFTASSSGLNRFVIKQNGNVNIGTQSAAIAPYKLYVSDYQRATASAMIENTSENNNTGTCTFAQGSQCHTGLLVKMGTTGSGTNPSSVDRYVSFLRGDGALMGMINGNGGAGISYTSSGADYGEYFKKENPDEQLPVGQMVCFGANGGVTACNNTNNKILGVVSNRSVVVGNNHDGDPDYVIVGLVGQLTVKVSTINGAIHNGDTLTVSPITGVAQKATKPGEVIGRAIGSYANPNLGEIGEIEVYISRTWYDPDIYLTTSGNINILENNPDSEMNTFTLQDSLGNKVERVGIFSEATIATLKAGSLDVKNLTIGGANINDRLLGLENGASLSAGLSNPIGELKTQMISLSDRVASLEASLQTGSFSPFSPFVASSSAELSLEKLDTRNATISGTLSVLGRTLLNDVGITGNVTMGVITINGLDENGFATINTTAGQLQLQSDGLNGLDFINGKVTIDTTGDIKTKGELTAKKINIDTTGTLSSSAGTGTVPAGDNSTLIHTTAVTAKSLIYVTFTSDYAPAIRYFIPAKVVHNSFTIELDKPVAEDAKFNWWIVN